MLAILSIVLFFAHCVYNSNGAAVISELDCKEPDIDLNPDEFSIENESKYELPTVFPKVDPNIDEDARLSVPELITKYGYVAEVHHVTTEDGYIIALHRIAGGEKSPPRKGKKVVYFMHGLGDSSAGIIISGPHHSLAYMLADNDYDVWLGNARGTVYSTNHTTLKPFGSLRNRRRYWAFSWHEIGVYDLPASIDYILAQTGEQKLQYIGHSQGGTSFFVMMSERPEYNDKVEMMHGLAPAAFLSHTKSPPIRAVVPLLPLAQKVRELIGFDYIRLNREFRIMAGELLCRDKVPTQAVCEDLLFLVMGYGSDQMNGTLLPVILGHAPAGAATNQFLHYGQEVNSGRFRQYDHGPRKNLFKYKRFTPPDYNLQNVKVPVAVYNSHNDWLATPKDIKILVDKLPNVLKHYTVPHDEFNHIDFLWGTEARILLYDEVLETMKAGPRQCPSTSDNEVDDENI